MIIHRFVRLIALFASIWSAAVTVPASAAPAGSYQQSCSRISQQGGVLIAYCTDVVGIAQATALADPGGCRGDIFNLDGKLFCPRGVDPPHGAYERSCDRIAIDGGDLRAICRMTAGFAVAAKLSGYRRCTTTIDNVDGSLVCRSPDDRAAATRSPQ